ncbi:MAG: COX15/CtaA family protein [Gammaproteobacteria bacterium]|nr:COX15/CtaA family protein [Gammaproteobacteria bacterium]
MPHTKKITLTAIVLAFIVIVFGAYVRLTDAGLGCPDWPGCYGFFSVPESNESLLEVEKNFPGQTVESGKAWREMIHRYIASTLGFLIVIIYFLYLSRKKQHREQEITNLPLYLLLLVIFQGLLGMWTVTLKVHPLIVSAHLVGGLSTLSLLFYYYKKQSTQQPTTKQKLSGFILLGFCFLIIQILLGGWTSTNYAALGCPDIPLCYGQLWPDNMDFQKGFLSWQSFGKNYEGGLLTPPARTAIHFTHRLGAVVVFFVLGAIGLKYLSNSNQQIKIAASYFLVALVTQLIIGIVMVWSSINLSLATAHNAFAAILLLSFINLLYSLKHR